MTAFLKVALSSLMMLVPTASLLAESSSFTLKLPLYGTFSEAPPTYSISYGDFGLCGDDGLQSRSALCTNDTTGEVVDLGLCGVAELTQPCTPPLRLILADSFLPSAQQDVPFSHDLSGLLSFTGGDDVRIEEAIFAGASTPEGLSISTSGLLSGTPSVAGDRSVTLTATLNGESVSKNYLLPINSSTYALQYSNWGTCSAAGSQARTATCRRNETNQNVAMSFCSAPVLTQSCTPPTQTLNGTLKLEVVDSHPYIWVMSQGSTTPTSYRGATIAIEAVCSPTSPHSAYGAISVSLSGSRAKNFFSSFSLQGLGRKESSSATHSVSNGKTTWKWTGCNANLSAWKRGQTKTFSITQ